MGTQWGRDKVYLRARQEGFRSRAAYKLVEIQRRFNVIRKTDNVIDLGAAPGSWLQVVRGLTDGKVLGIDLSPIPPMDNVETITGDLTDPGVQAKARELLGVVSVVVSDASPKLSGHKSYDQARAVALGAESLHFACSVLKPGGNFIVKSFQGTDFSDLFHEVKRHFHSVRNCNVQATRKGSTEIYIVAKNFMG
ncbi:MAG TPA: RlmE family RNA methyltransferase [Methanoregulaceae archaeon]|nr:RlmE family RNA methyltransferase [Methanoregulaceae archaeon]HPD74741.1 RlmE family RNA methyltransferase [Methanoregulaceae archaeon]HRY74696.1 RlmE family RNA methyltransferase [Methanoregulaceae archaeon]